MNSIECAVERNDFFNVSNVYIAVFHLILCTNSELLIN